MPPETHRCPDCGRICSSATELADHALYVHVDAPTPAGHIRPQRHSGMASKVAVGIAIVLGVGFWTLAFLAEDLFTPDSAPLRPGSVVHRMAVDLERSGAIDDFRSVEPNEGWEVEYELDEGDGYIRIRDEGITGEEDLEYEAWDGDLEAAMEEAIREQGFLIED